MNMKNPYISGIVAGLVLALIIGWGAIKTPTFVAQAQSPSVSTASQNLWRRIGQNIFPTDTAWNIGIGTQSPSSKLTVKGFIESTLDGFKFPDGTIQATAQLVGPGGPQGPMGPQGPAGTPGQQLHIYDALDRDLGVLVSAGLWATDFLTFLENEQILFRIGGALSAPYLPPGGVSELYFLQPNCSGTAYLADYAGGPLGSYQYIILANRYFKTSNLSPVSGVTFVSKLGGNICYTSNYSQGTLYPLTEFILPFLPLATPLRIGY